MTSTIVDRNLLERGIPVDLINEEAKKEKIGMAKSPLTNMHYFHTRKPLVSSRLVVAGTLLSADSVKTPNELNKLIGIDPKSITRAYKVVPSALINKVGTRYPTGTTILDPFAGSGMIPFEILRLGLDVVAFDYNPVAYLILKGTLEYPIKYGDFTDKKSGNSKLYEEVKKYAEEITAKLKTEFSELYPSHEGNEIRAYFHAWSVTCPTCGKNTPLINTWWLHKKKKLRLNYEVKNGKLELSIVKSNKEIEGNMKRGYATCLICSSKISNDHITDEISRKDEEILLAVSLTNGNFEMPTDKDIDALVKAKELLKSSVKSLASFIPAETMPDDMRSLPAKKYLTYWRRLFGPRQLLLIANLAREIRKTIEGISQNDRDYAAAIGVYLSMIMANHINRNSRSTMWIEANQTISNSVFNRGIGMMWNHAEANPFSESSGSLSVATKSVLNGLAFASEELKLSKLEARRKPKVEVFQASAMSWRPPRKFKFIITDPPYYDDVPYPEVLQFFQVWHNRTVGDLLNIPATPSTNEDLSVGRDRDDKTFETRLLAAIKNIFNLLEEDGILSMFYAHRSIEGWKYLLEALRKTGFNVTSTIALMTESKESVITKGRFAIFHSLLLTARKRKVQKTTSLMDLEEEIRKEIEERYPDLEKTYGKDRMNLMLAASGIVIEAITSYSEITSFTRNTADYALEMGQRFLIEAFARRTLDVDHADPKTMVYTWFRHSIQDYIDFSEFNQTLKALGTGEEAVADIIERAKDDRSKVRLLDFSERGALEIEGMEPLIARSIIDAVHISLRAYVTGGITAAKGSVNSSPFGREVILNTMDALSKIYATKGNYREGETCRRFLEEWNAVYGGEQRTVKQQLR
jgi:putative DNA methylase